MPVASKFCLVVNRDEVCTEIEPSVINIGVNDGRDLRVVIDVVLVITCGVVEFAKEPEIKPLSGVARRGLVGADTDRGKVIAGGRAGDEGKWMSK